MSDPGNQRYRCVQCTMSFRIDDQPRKAAVTRCSQCRLLFWHGHPTGANHVVVGIEPAELHQQCAKPSGLGRRGVEVTGLQRRSGA